MAEWQSEQKQRQVLGHLKGGQCRWHGDTSGARHLGGRGHVLTVSQASDESEIPLALGGVGPPSAEWGHGVEATPPSAYAHQPPGMWTLRHEQEGNLGE